jgi:SAM-dependent methyltransferase
MVELAQKLNPGITFEQGDMAALDVEDGAWVGIVAFNSIIHFPRPHVVPVLQKFRRVLRPNGLLLLSFWQGQEVRHVEEWLGKPVWLDGIFFEREEPEEYLKQVGFAIEESIGEVRYAEDVWPRDYILARKPS